jgi:hypothetical protein
MTVTTWVTLGQNQMEEVSVITRLERVIQSDLLRERGNSTRCLTFDPPPWIARVRGQ